jgi:hypothetical protein
LGLPSPRWDNLVGKINEGGNCKCERRAEVEDS